MRLIRSAGQNVSPSDDGRLYDQIFADGLFEDATFANLGQNNVAVSEIYGIICGRDFTCEAQTIQVTLPEEESTVTGYIYLEVNTAAENVFTINSALAPFTPTYEDINVSGTICQMVLATYTATQLQIESITPQYVLASAGAVGSLASIESSPAKSNHAKNAYLVYQGILYKARTAIAAGEELVVGTNISRAYVGTELTSLNNGLMDIHSSSEPLFKYHEYRYDYTGLAAGGDLMIKASQLGLVRPDGYTPISTNMYITDKASVLVRYINTKAQNDDNAVALRNTASSAQTGYFRMRVIFAKTSLFKGF